MANCMAICGVTDTASALNRWRLLISLKDLTGTHNIVPGKFRAIQREQMRTASLSFFATPKRKATYFGGNAHACHVAAKVNSMASLAPWYRCMEEDGGVHIVLTLERQILLLAFVHSLLLQR